MNLSKTRLVTGPREAPGPKPADYAGYLVVALTELCAGNFSTTLNFAGMTRYIAFLRAINVGGHVVKMDQLRRFVAASIGARKVDTYIASGNVIFESSAQSAKTLEKKIAEQLEKALGYEVATFIRTAEELREIAEYEPFADSKVKVAGASLYIGFLADKLGPAGMRTVASFRTDVDKLRVHQREIYWQCRIRSSESEFSLARLEKALRIQATFRNSTTVKKIAALYPTAKS